MAVKSKDPNVPSRVCANWPEIAECLEGFPAPEVAMFEDGDLKGKEWIFRGHTDSCFQLVPAIEREADGKSISWRALEELVAGVFKSHARMHLSPTFVPEPQDELTWLAQMQHYGVPTRLLDFTYSPFVALYFAIRKQEDSKSRTHVRLWAMNATQINNRFTRVAIDAAREVGQWKPHAVSLDPDKFSTDGDTIIAETQGLHKLIRESLSATGKRRAELERQGSVAVASPPSFNPRLASQQGVFLVNCAEGLPFGNSLSKMMAVPAPEWCKRFDIVKDAIPDIEQRLFQMNIHEQALFPDMEGLAGFTRQKIRLHWK